MRSAILLAILLASAFAGCARPQENPYEPPVTDDTGTLRVVVQSGRDRVVNATVLILPWGESAATDAYGIAVFADLSPASGSVRVNADGYFDKSTSAAVQKGNLTEVVVFLDRMRR